MDDKIQKKYFPMFIDLFEKNVVVIGGGTIASRRVNTLVNFTEKMVIVSPKLTENLQKLYQQGKIGWKQSEYQIEQIKTDCKKLEKEMGRQILVSVIDDRELCDFYFPSIVETEDVVIGINSGGKSPSLTKQIRKEVEEVLKCNSIYKC